MKKSILIAVVLLLANLMIADAQILLPVSPFIINVDMSRFRYLPEKGYVELYYAAYPRSVTLEKNRDTLRGSVILRTKIINIQNNSLMANSTVSLPFVIVDSASFQAGYIGKSAYALPPGAYELLIQGYDNGNLSRQDSIRKRFSIDRYTDSSAVSDIDLCSRISPSEDKGNPFYKNSYEVVPNPSLVFGSQIAPVVFSYAELYNLTPNLTYSILVGIMDGKGTLVKQRKLAHRYTGRNVADVNSLNVNSILSGRYRFVLVITDTLEHEIARSEKPIYIHNSHLQSGTLTSISARSAEFIGLSNDELVDEFRKAQYIASSDDIETFEKLTTEDARREFLAKFWTDVENGQRGRTDLTRSLYLERVIRANRRYTVLGQKGWKTDRGRVYILFAEPDEVERFPSSENSKPFEIWHYYQIENGVQFVFIDRTGYGQYVLSAFYKTR